MGVGCGLFVGEAVLNRKRRENLEAEMKNQRKISVFPPYNRQNSQNIIPIIGR